MERQIEQIVARQLAGWRAGQQQRSLVPAELAEGQDRPCVITVSVAVGADCGSVVAQIADRLGIPHHDHDIVEHIASSARVRLQTVEGLDQHVQSRVDEYLESLFHERNFDRSDYMRLLGRVVVALWEHGPCVFSGHGTVHLIPRDYALAVRLVAPNDVRVQRLAQQGGIDPIEARRQLQRADAEQAAFHRRYFDAQVDDAAHYDLVIDTSRFGQSALVELVLRSFALRFPRESSS